ncbi:UNKNOWN [Stylonychia lemnae]|uniref:Uncharacterized protein n=1 Tax=Stylonychia lemnae TaxID=5949 RepID=A0A077ZWP1_STYLE|nr:UNKNOWN [Stylonychia lemnae]|eukprot:CDW72906.1 UNKNOWN [Stylonychia lemnae]
MNPTGVYNWARTFSNQNLCGFPVFTTIKGTSTSMNHGVGLLSSYLKDRLTIVYLTLNEGLVIKSFVLLMPLSKSYNPGQLVVSKTQYGVIALNNQTNWGIMIFELLTDKY